VLRKVPSSTDIFLYTEFTTQTLSLLCKYKSKGGAVRGVTLLHFEILFINVNRGILIRCITCTSMI